MPGKKLFLAVAAAALCLAAAAVLVPLGEGGLRFEITETAPAALNLPEIRDTGEVWLELIRGARSTIDIEVFILDRPYSERWLLDNVYDALIEAGERGVRVRVLVDGLYASEWASELDGHPGIEVRYWFGDGVLHSKYLVVDREVVSVGSTNFSSYSVGGGGDGNREVNLTIWGAEAAEAYTYIFDRGWEQAGGEPSGAEFRWDSELLVPVADGVEGVTGTVEAMRRLIERARERVWIYMYVYAGAPPELESAIFGALGRGVQVRLMVDSRAAGDAGWRAELEELERAGAEVYVIEHPFTAHPKIIIVDGEWVYVGSANIHPEWMLSGREVGAVVRSAEVVRQLEDIFLADWISTYTRRL